MKKRLRKHKVNRVGKKLISLVIVFSLLIGDIPVSEIVQMIVENLSSLLSVEVSAAAGDPYDRIDEYTKHYISGGADTGYILIESWDDLIWYSQSYYNYSLGNVYNTTVEHEKDVLFINFGSNQGNNYSLNGRNYVPIGNDTKPFEGKIVFSNSSAADTFNVPESLFGTISEKVTIKNQTGSAVKQIKLTRTGTGNGDVLFAKKVKSDNNNATYADWDIVFDKFDDSSAVSYAGLIGELEAGANVHVTFVNNSILTKSDLLANATSSDTNGKPVDAGVLCGKMGARATLTATYSGSNTDYNITSENGNAGGLVGSMGVDSVLAVTASNLQGTSASVTALNGYAGGIVGKNDGGTVTITPSSGTKYTISQIIHGKDGTGGLFGYYAPPSAASASLDLSNYTVNCKLEHAVSNTGFAGGIIGVIENVPAEPAGRVGGSLTIKGMSDGSTVVTSAHVSQTDAVTGNPTGYKATAYGGLIGSYKASDTAYSLNIKDIATAPANTLASSFYGGGIGKIDDASYVKFETFKLNSAAGTRSEMFGGLVADNPKGYIYADGSTTNANCTGIVIGSSKIEGFTGGGLVGNLGDGVLGMKGTINVSNAEPTAADTNGHLVGTRDNALIYADGNLTYTMSSKEVDNVGSWGDVLVIDGTKLKMNTTNDTLNVFSESNHIITIGSVTTTAIANAADYAKASLRFQIDSSKNIFITNYTKLDSDVGLELSGDIVLTGTGLRGITRDSGTSCVEFTGTIDGNDYKITFDIKNVGGSNRPVYRKQYLGLVAIANGASFGSIDFDGTILSKNSRTTENAKSAYVGTAAATVSSSVTCSDSNTLSTLSMSLTGGVSTIGGRLIGEVTGSAGNIDISESIFDGGITGNSNCIVGGVIGKIAGGADNAVWSFDDVTLKGNVTGVQKIGGLIAVLDGSSKATVKIGETTAVKTDGIKVEGSDTQFMGGLFGYEWKNADVVIDDFKIADTTSTITTVKQTGAGSTAGLACYASGHWTVNKLDLRNIKMLTSTAASVGMIVNRGKIGTDGIYLELPSGYDYKLSFHSDSAFSGVFDEICAYSADNANKIMNNGQGIVSISTTGLTMSATASDSLSYKNQTVQGKYKNGNTRYYYNLDTIDKDNTLSLDEKKLMRWGVRQYACSNIQSYFPNPFNNNTIIPAGTYNMQGYSWYPVTPLNAMTVNGTFTFYNKEFDDCEKVKGRHANISSNDDRNIWSPLEVDQHYMMQNGLFYNVNKNLTIGTISLAGTIGAVDSTSGTGALVYGTVSGSKTDTSTNITTIDSTGTGHSISLAGVKIWNLGDLTGNTVYAPLLINQASDYVTLNIGNVSTTSAYKVTDNGASTTPSAATCLIGKAGTRATASDDNPISQGITVTFSNIALDGRNAEGNSVYDDTRYNTTKSIFTDSTLLWQLIGSSGTYNFEYDEDWASSTPHPHKVTYGKELGYTTEGQYPNLELWYQDELKKDPTTLLYIGKQRYVHPDAVQPDSGSTQYTSFSNFLPYVNVVSTKANIDNKSAFCYQLMVNHQPSIKIEGCGTYNDPYIITNASNLITISKWLAADANLNGEIDIDPDEDGWCDADNGVLYQEHVTYMCTSSGGTASGYPSKTAAEIRQYLAGAYYQIRLSGVTEIELKSDSEFVGFGTADIPFHGVIDGGENVVKITNKTSYPLINYSSGCVIRKINLIVDSSGLNLTGSDKKYKSYIKLFGKKSVYTANEKNTYGAVISKIIGGDNIIDNVQVNLDDLKIWLTDSYQQFAPVGGYVGVIVDGGLIFRNMSGNISGFTINANITSDNGLNNTNMLDSDNNTWLFVNPIIGRVINGFAVTESTTGYKPREANETMKNSMGNHDIVKNYSISDIATSGGTLSVDASSTPKKITVSNSQSFLVMSLIVNSGMGSSKLGYLSGGSNIRRHAAYDSIGSNALLSTSCADYNTFAYLDFSSSSPYLIYKYAGDSAPIGSYNWEIELTSDSYNLSDGYRGIGNFFNAYDTDLCLSVNNFIGNGAEIFQNTKYYYYSDDSAAYKPLSSEYAGLGLFNCIDYSGTFTDFILTGSVKCDVLDRNTGSNISYSVSSTNANGNLSAGMLFGVVYQDIHPTIDSVALQNIDVRGVRHTGGMIGNIPVTGTYKENNKTYPCVVSISNTNSYGSYGIKVHGAGSTAGLIGRNQQGVIQVDLNNCHFDITEVISECVIRNISNHPDYNYGVGGFIGICRSTSGTPNLNNKIKNIIIGSNEKQAIVNCTEGGEIFVGGVIGVINRANVEVTNCDFYNISVESRNYMAGGLVADCITESTPTVYNTHIYGNNSSSIIGLTNSGGFIGNTDERYQGGETFKLQNSSISGYTIQGSTAGGVIGHRGAKNNNCVLQMENIVVEDCTIKADTSAGGIAGQIQRPIQGYNILCKNIKILPIESTLTNKGYIVGLNYNAGGNSNDTTVGPRTIKIVGFSRQEVLGEGESSSMVQELTGGSGTPTNYGTGGYVIFADYLGTASYTESNGVITPGANSSASFSNMTTNSDVTPAAPYVTTSPVMNIANKNSVMQYLLSDGVSPLTSAAFGRSTQAFADIYDDISNSNAGYYQIPSSYLDTDDEYKAYTTKISSFKTEMGDKLADGIDFPVLVLDKINPGQMTEFINKYICLLTNTTTSSVSVNGTLGKYNFADVVPEVYNVVLKRVTFNSDKETIKEIVDDNVCLKKANGQFRIESDDTDTAASNAQFTLIDIQFYDPSSVSYNKDKVLETSKLKVAYHLYIPCYVRKLLEYDFDIHIDSGTSYDINNYTQLVENNLVENIGTPVTLEFAFTYQRTAAEWTDAVNGGDSLLSNYPKSLLFDNATNVASGSRPQFPASTKMVLIDTQNNSRAYYLDGLNNTSFTPSGDFRTLNFSSFTDINSTAFTPVCFNDMLNVSVAEATGGNLVPDNTNAIVKDTTTGIKYRYATEAEKSNGSIQKYTATVSFKNDGDTALSEHYFLTIYTPYSTTDVVYHYVIQAQKDLGINPYPSRITAESEGNVVHLYTGYIYDNNVYIDSLKVGGVENNTEITAEDNSIEATIHAEIGLTTSGEENIRSTLSGTSPPDIFQSFLIKLNKDGNIGLAAASAVTVENYTIGGRPVTSLNPLWTSSDYTDIRIPSYIEMRNGVPLATQLSNVSQNATLNISAKATITFDNDNGDITAQFFPQTDTRRTTLIAYSNIASSSDNTASSNVSASKDYIDVSGVHVTSTYYTKLEEKAILNYDALDIPADGSNLPQLGINANDPKDAKKLPALIKTVASYNVENCQAAWQAANYLKLEIELKSKNDNYTASLNIFDYIRQSTFSIFDGEYDYDDRDSTRSTSTKLVYVISKTDLESFYNDKVYRIPIDFNVYSGSGADNNFESQNRQYSNYGIFINVSMLQAAKSPSAVVGTEPETTNNYVKYTNARIYIDKLNAGKAWSPP